MSFNVRHKPNAYPLAATNINGQTAGTVVTGQAVSGTQVAIGTLSALVTVAIVTGSLTFTPKWQASEDGTNWYDLSQVALPAITASGSRFVPMPDGIWRYMRLALTTGGATGGASDTYAVSYVFNTPEFV